MRTLDEARTMFPNHGSLSDIELAETIKKEYYPDVSDEEFYSATGYPKRMSQSEAALGSFLASGQSLYQGIKQLTLPTANDSSLKKEGSKPESLMQTISSVPKIIGGYITGSTLDEEKEKQTAEEREKFISQSSEQHPWTTTLSQIAGDILFTSPVMAAKLPMSAIKATKSLSAPAKTLVENVGTGATQSGLAGYAQYAESPEKRMENATLSAVLGGGAGGILSAGTMGGQSIRNKLRGNQSIEMLEANIKASEGMKSGLGRIFNNKDLMELQENVLQKVPFGGGSSLVQEQAKELSDGAQDLYIKMTGHAKPEGDSRKIVHEDLINNVDRIFKQDRENYAVVKSLSEEANLPFDITKIYKATEESLEKAKGKGVTKAIPMKDAENTLSKMLTSFNKESPDLSKSNDDILNVNDLRGRIWDLKTQAQDKGSNYEASLYNDIYRATSESITDFGKNIPEEMQGLKRSFDEAQGYHKNMSAPIKEDKKIMGYYRDRDLKNSEKIVDDFLTTGRGKDNYETLNKLTSLLGSDGLSAAREYKFSEAVDEFGIDPAKMRTTFEKLGSTQKEILFSDNKDLLQEMSNFSKKVDFSPEAINYMFNAKNGQRALNMEMIAKISSAGGMAGLFTGAPVMALIPAAFGAAAGASKLALNKLTSEGTRNRLLENMKKDIAGETVQSNAIKQLMKLYPAIGASTAQGNE